MFIRSVDQIAKKWADVTPMRSADYEAGVLSPRRSWSAATKNAESAYEEGVKKAMTRKAFSKGVVKAGDEKWQRKASVNGVARWGPGVSEAEGDYKAGYSPYQSVIAALVLPPRYARRDPRNIARVTAIAKALGDKKESISGK